MTRLASRAALLLTLLSLGLSAPHAHLEDEQSLQNPPCTSCIQGTDGVEGPSADAVSAPTRLVIALQLLVPAEHAAPAPRPCQARAPPQSALTA